MRKQIPKLEAIHSSETSVKFTRHHIPEDSVLQSHFLGDGPSSRTVVYNIVIDGKGRNFYLRRNARTRIFMLMFRLLSSLFISFVKNMAARVGLVLISCHLCQHKLL